MKWEPDEKDLTTLNVNKAGNLAGLLILRRMRTRFYDNFAAPGVVEAERICDKLFYRIWHSSPNEINTAYLTAIAVNHRLAGIDRFYGD